MEAVIHDDVSGKEATHEVSETATAGGLLEEACTLFGREVLDSALEVDGAVVCTGVVGGVNGGEASVGGLGVHSDSKLMLCRSRDRVLEVVAEWRGSAVDEDSLPAWAWDDEVVALAAVGGFADTFKFVSERLRSSDSFMHDAVTRKGRVLQYASVTLRADRRLVQAAVASDSSAMDYASKELKADKEFILAVVAHNGFPLRFVSETLKADKEVVLSAVASNGNALQHASAELQADKQVVLAAVASQGLALSYASEACRADKHVVLTAVAQQGVSIRYASKKLQTDQHVRAAAYGRQSPKLVQRSGLSLLARFTKPVWSF